MSMPHWLASFNRRVANRFVDPLARRMPGFGVVVHTGRKTHREYRTPVAVFRGSGVYVLVLAFGRDADWVRNVVANGGCVLETRGALPMNGPRMCAPATQAL
jgi:deazaflavin-dependent oxidoreductase (nitroreductase family)